MWFSCTHAVSTLYIPPSSLSPTMTLFAHSFHWLHVPLKAQEPHNERSMRSLRGPCARAIVIVCAPPPPLQPASTRNYTVSSTPPAIAISHLPPPRLVASQKKNENTAHPTVHCVVVTNAHVTLCTRHKMSTSCARFVPHACASDLGLQQTITTKKHNKVHC
jgi:hypothetical protein